MLINHRDWENFPDLLTKDFLWTCSAPLNTREEGRDAMMKMLRESQTYAFGWIFQMPHGVVIDTLDGDHATARHTLHIMSDHMDIVGLYYDSVVRESDGAWRFVRRDYQITFYTDKPTPGQLYRKVPDPGNPSWYFKAKSS